MKHQSTSIWLGFLLGNMSPECVNHLSKAFTSHLLWAPSLFATLEGPAMESSSKPSQPCTTRARFMPSKTAFDISLGGMDKSGDGTENIPREALWVINIFGLYFLWGGGKRRTWSSKIIRCMNFERFVRGFTCLGKLYWAGFSLMAETLHHLRCTKQNKPPTSTCL